ncbi:ubiquitin carboxyl-terminal hydrolase 34 [Brachionus plicatilis]|uniref:Ubiquitin carboxyl-terminal hydrolase 34 n=1 Tax=Brachionus plicatilis TaxID=10195 RepID=A0A3M7RA89_BRAPC|nr:ubiquitin carboxyl-terminal hydrolase 34 [Brachionus plicatilis]
MLAPYHAEPGQLTDSFTRTVNTVLLHLLSLMSVPLGPSEPQSLHAANLIQYFTLLIYLLVGNEQKRLVVHHDALQLFWDNIFFKHMANSHVTTNLNKQVMIHFVYHCLNGCVQVLDYVTRCADGKFEMGMARELPLCTVIVDHEDAELVSYNKQCLQPFYGAIRLLCDHSPVYLRHMCEHSNLQWAFKHVLPYSMHYGTACVELVKLLELVCRQSGQIKESVCGQFLMSAAVEAKQSFQSIVWVVKAVMRTNDDVTLAKTEGVQQIVANWKEKFELIKRLVVLASFWVAGSTRATALELMRAVLEVSPVEMAANTVAILKQSYAGLSYYQSCQSYQKGSILSAKSTVNSLQKCFMGNQSINQAVCLMGPYFPVPANCVLGAKKLKTAFNLYLPLTLVNHCHYDGSVYMLSKIVGHLTEYEKNLRDSFLPLFNFYHFLFKRLFDQLTSLNEQSSKNLADLVLIVSTQSMYFNMHFIGYLSDRADCLAEHITQSIHLNHFVRVLITDYRHLVSRDEYATFLAGFVGRFVRNLLPRNQLNSDSFSHLLSQTIKNTIRLSLSTINETRFYFDFGADKLGDECAPNLDIKLSAMLGSIKCVQMVTRAVSRCKVDKQFVKFVKQLKDFFVSYWEHVSKQSEEMSKYLDDEGPRSKKVKLEEVEGGDLRARLESKRKCVGAVLEALKENIDLMNGLMQGVEAMDDESADETTDNETSSSSSSSQEEEASTESGSNNEHESASEHEQTNV